VRQKAGRDPTITGGRSVSGLITLAAFAADGAIHEAAISSHERSKKNDISSSRICGSLPNMFDKALSEKKVLSAVKKTGFIKA
jgi:hypothetical protein